MNDVPIQFRRILQQEADRWRSEGFIDANFHAQLATRYQFDKLDTEANGTFVSAIFGLGGVLIGLGILTFVALNWQYLDKPYRIILLLSGLVAANTSGFYLWQKSQSRRLGEGLLLLGAMIFGADLALLAQLFHVDGDIFVLFMGWAIGVLLMAYALRLQSIGVMAIALMGCGYWSAASAGIGFAGAGVSNAPMWAQWLYQYMPIWAIGLFLPLAYRCRSPLIFGLTAIAWLTALPFTVTASVLPNSQSNITPFLLTVSLPLLLFWAMGRVQSYFPHPAYRKQFANFSQRMAIFSGGLSCFFLSQDYFAFGKPSELEFYQNPFIIGGLRWDLLLLVGLTIGLWAFLWRSTSRWQPNDLLILGLGGSITGLLAIASKSYWVFLATPWLFCLLLAAVTLLCIRNSLQTADRGAFYFGWLLLATRLLIWFTFTQTDLNLKALLFIITGAATISIGIWFERRLRLVR